MTKLLITVVFLFSILLSIGQNIFDEYDHLFSAPRNYVVYQTTSEIIIDGKPDEISWKLAPWSEYFEDIEGNKKPAPTFQTRFKMLWDKKNLYILAELEEPHIWAYYTKRDQIVYHENDFEIFIDPDGDTHNYFEFELNAQNTLFDLFMPKPYRNGGKYDIVWDAKGFESAVFIDGTLNNPADIDRKWSVEISIPFSSLEIDGEYLVPNDGESWKINFSRVQWQTEIVNGKYQKVKNKETNQFLSEDNWVWSKQGVINMHFPERWGIAQFSTKPVGDNEVDFVFPEEEILAKYLWLIYYKQQNFKSLNGNFASTLSDLDLDKQIKTESGETILLRMEVNNNGFKAFLENYKGLKLSVNQDGLFRKMTK